MTNPTQSLINFGSIDATYPVAGQDNNSQGFRDNFSSIRTGLGQASTEITSLQQNAAFVNANNNFGGNTITNAIYNQLYGTFLSLGTVTSNQDINLQNGPVQSVYLASNVTLTFRNWPASGSYGLIRLFVFSDGAGVRSPLLATASGNSIKYSTNFPTLPGSTTPGVVVGGEKVVSVAVTQAGSGYTLPVSVGFAGGSPQATGSVATATANYKIVSATVNGGYAGNGYAINDVIMLNSNPNVQFSVSALNLGFTANTTNGDATIRNLSSVLNLGAGVAVSGPGIPAGTYIGSVNVGALTATLVASDGTTPVNATATATSQSLTYVSTTGPIGALTVTSAGVFSLPASGSFETTLVNYPTVSQGVQSTGAGARVVLSFGINAVTITYSGNGYTQAPSVTFTGGGGTGTLATATISTDTKTNPKVIEASSYDGGTTVYIRYVDEFH
jgi:hypothetical protein